jgi:hypothetical protein
MKYYAVVEVAVTDDSWVADYLPNVTALVHKHGGKYLARTMNPRYFPSLARVSAGERRHCRWQYSATEATSAPTKTGSERGCGSLAGQPQLVDSMDQRMELLAERSARG